MITANIKRVLILVGFILVVSCNKDQPQTLPTVTDCEEKGSMLADNAADGLSFDIYLPPCYTQDTNVQYPVLIWTTLPLIIDSTVENMIKNQTIHPMIVVMPFNAGGQNYEQRLAEELVPYLDANYRTIAERPFRAIAGISHGGAIAARSGWRYPELFGQTITISGGIAHSEKEKFHDWIAVLSPEEYPQILIDVGTEDGIMPLTDDYRNVLDSQNVPYTYTSQGGGHTQSYWIENIPNYLLWLDNAWQTQAQAN